MELDGRTPDDQPAASPVMWTGLQSPRGFDWAPGGSALWIADASSDGVERLRVIDSTADRPRRAAQRGAYVLPRGLGAAGVAFFGAGAVEEFSGDLFVAGRDAGYILRIRFDETGRPVTTERLLEGRAGTVRALAMGTDGAIYFCTDTLLARLRRVN
ncbi:MAG TPA: PQQ-dependent sugar dehydrogenase [Vicinamibacterales bacterium]|nr:PQQ-dependent sugar dehydrogenase [Vicinamibacterales bacterium]